MPDRRAPRPCGTAADSRGSDERTRHFQLRLWFVVLGCSSRCSQSSVSSGPAQRIHHGSAMLEGLKLARRRRRCRTRSRERRVPSVASSNGRATLLMFVSPIPCASRAARSQMACGGRAWLARRRSELAAGVRLQKLGDSDSSRSVGITYQVSRLPFGLYWRCAGHPAGTRIVNSRHLESIFEAKRLDSVPSRLTSSRSHVMKRLSLEGRRMKWFDLSRAHRESLSRRTSRAALGYGSSVLAALPHPCCRSPGQSEALVGRRAYGSQLLR